MHPLAIFPQLFFLQLFAPLLLRVCVGLFMMYSGKERNQKIYNWSAFIYFLSGLLLILGFYTQIAVIVSIVLTIFDLYLEKNNPLSIDKKFLYLFVIIILLSLLFTGPGFFALDLPL